MHFKGNYIALLATALNDFFLEPLKHFDLKKIKILMFLSLENLTNLL